MMRILSLMVISVLMPVLASADEAQDKVIAAISAICVDGYGSGQTLEAAEGFDGAVKFQDPTPDSVSYRVEIAPERYSVIAFRKEGGACSVIVPIEHAPDLDDVLIALGGRLLVSEEVYQVIFVADHSLIAVSQDAKFRGDGQEVRDYAFMKKPFWDAIVAQNKDKDWVKGLPTVPW